MIELFRDAYRYRELIWALSMKELTVRYKRSALGFLWALLNPLLMMVIYSVVFSTIMAAKIQHYAVFLLSMLIPWTFFAQSMAYASESIVGNADLIKKVRVPRSVFPIAAVISNIINFLLSLIPLLLIVLALQHPVFVTWFFLPIPLLALTIFTVGATFLFATANVFYRDVAHILQIVIQMWFYITPVLYSIDFFPAQYRWVFKLNPLIYVMNDFRMSIYYGQLPQTQSVVASFICGFIALFFGLALFRKYENQFVYYV